MMEPSTLLKLTPLELEAIGLSHRRVFLDPAIEASVQERIAATVAARVARRRRFERTWTLVGRIALGLLVARALADLL